MPKEMRAELHERFAGWLERAASKRVLEYEEILGFHLEQACRFRLELAPPDDATWSLGARAGEHLSSAGERALARSDAPAAISLLDRALAVLPPQSPIRPKLLCDLGYALGDRGEFARAEAVLSDARTAAEARNEPSLAAIASMRSTWVQLLAGEALMAESKDDFEQWVHTLEDVGDESAVAEAYSFLGTLLMWAGRCADAMDALEHSASLARRVGADKIASRSLTWLIICAFWGPMPVADGLVLCDRVASSGNDRVVRGFASMTKGLLTTMAGELERGRQLTATARKLLGELGQDVTVASTRMAVGRTEYLSGRVREAENELRLGYDALERMGERGFLSTTAAMLAEVLCAQGRHSEAQPFVQAARELGAKDDLTTELYWRCAQAEILASQGEFVEARGLMQEAHELIGATDFIHESVAALVSRAVVGRAAGSQDEAQIALEQAIALLEKKGDVTAAAHVRQRMGEL
jgi:ATP/maltotriose-dependent transcriptional regulator MalT